MNKKVVVGLFLISLLLVTSLGIVQAVESELSWTNENGVKISETILGEKVKLVLNDVSESLQSQSTIDFKIYEGERTRLIIDNLIPVATVTASISGSVAEGEIFVTSQDFEIGSRFFFLVSGDEQGNYQESYLRIVKPTCGFLDGTCEDSGSLEDKRKIPSVSVTGCDSTNANRLDGVPRQACYCEDANTFWDLSKNVCQTEKAYWTNNQETEITNANVGEIVYPNADMFESASRFIIKKDVRPFQFDQTIKTITSSSGEGWTIGEIGTYYFIIISSAGEEIDSRDLNKIGGELLVRTINCGNGVIDAGETCDGGTNLICDPIAFPEGGILSCDFQCQIDTSECLPKTDTPVCGNNKIESGETCDGTYADGDWGSYTPNDCNRFDGFDFGTLGCYSSGELKCKFDTSNCRTIEKGQKGICGSSDEKGNFDTKPSANLCDISSNTPSVIEVTGEKWDWEWTCQGTGEEVSDYCVAYKNEPKQTVGQCSTETNGEKFESLSSLKSNDMCDPGKPINLIESGDTWTWRCEANDGTGNDCSAIKTGPKDCLLSNCENLDSGLHWTDAQGEAITNAQIDDAVYLLWVDSGLAEGTSVSFKIEEADTTSKNDDLDSVITSVNSYGHAIFGGWTITYTHWNAGRNTLEFEGDKEEFIFKVIDPSEVSLESPELDVRERPESQDGICDANKYECISNGDKTILGTIGGYSYWRCLGSGDSGIDSEVCSYDNSQNGNGGGGDDNFVTVRVDEETTCRFDREVTGDCDAGDDSMEARFSLPAGETRTKCIKEYGDNYDGVQPIICPVKLPVFNQFNFVIALALIALIYFVLLRKKK